MNKTRQCRVSFRSVYTLFFYKNNFIRTVRLKLGKKIRTTKKKFGLNFQKCSEQLLG